MGYFLVIKEEVSYVRDRVVSETKRKMKQIIRDVTKWEYDALVDMRSEPAKSIVREMKSVRMGLIMNYDNLTSEQFREIADLKLMKFDMFCRSIWKKVPQLVPSSFLDRY